MEDPLIHQTASSSHDVSPKRGSSPEYSKPTDALAFGDKYQKAAALVDLAADNVGLPEEVLEQSNFEHAVGLYFIYLRLNLLWSLNLTALIVLNFFEMPLWCKGFSHQPCGSRRDYYLGELPYMTRKQSLLFEVVTLVILLAHTFFPIVYTGNRLFWKSRVELIKVLLVMVLTADIFVDALYVIPSGPVHRLDFRFAPYLRVFILVVNVRALRDYVKTLVVISPVLDIAALLLLFLLFSSGLAFVLFEDTNQGRVYFPTYGMTLYRMFVLFTTSNNPDVWLPAYKASRVTCLFFILYILFGVYFITNLILAVVYDSFKQQLAKQIREMRLKRNKVLETAFKLLDVQDRGYLDLGQCVSLFKELNRYRTLPKIEEENFEAIFYVLDDSGDFKINKEEFEDLCEGITLKFPKMPKPSWLEKFPFFYRSTFSTLVKDFVKSKYFEYVVSGMLLLNLVAVIIETTLDLQNNSTQHFWQDIEFIFGWLYVVEMALKIYAYGFEEYWREGQNKFDFIITLIVVVGETLTFVLPNSVPIISNEEWIRYLIIARLLRVVRLLMRVERYRVIIGTFLKLIPRLTPYLAIIFCLMCLYSSLGVQLFGGLVYSGNPSIEDTDLFENDYLVHNFNDYPTGMVTLFELLVMGNWQVWLESYVALTGTWWTAIYFISFYAVAVLYLLNLVVAFVLEVFFAEMDVSSTRKDSPSSQMDMANSQQKAQQAKSENVESLLNRMLSAELENMEGN